MKRYLFVLLLLPLMGMAQHITIHAKNQPIKQVFEQIQAASNYYILYSDEVVTDSIKVNVNAEQLSVNAVLDQALTGTGLTYQVTARGMVIVSAKSISDLVNKSAQARIAGQVFSGGQPLPFASVTLFKEGKVLTGDISSDQGIFTLSHPLNQKTTYLLRVTAIGYQTFNKTFAYPDTAFLKNINLQEEVRQLNTVNIVGQKQLVTRKADRYIVNVAGSILENGFSALEVLQRSPGLWVNTDGSVRIKGNQSVMVMINDVVQRMSSEELAEYLRSLKSESIASVEVISNPPSEYEASSTGGIVHIILKKSRSDGTLANLSALYRQQKERPLFTAGGMLDHKAGNLYLFGHLFATSDESKYIGTYNVTYPDQSRYSSFTNRFNHNQRLQYRLGGAYDIGKNQSVSLQTTGNANKLEQSFLTDIRLNNVTGFTNSRWLRHPDQNSSTVNYNWKQDSLGSMLKVIADYTYAQKTELNQFDGTFTEVARNSVFRVNTPNTTDILSVQTDYVKILPKKMEFKTGLKFASTKRDNELLREDFINDVWTINQPGSNHFLYRENLFMAYASVAKDWPRTSLKAGLRGEETRLQGNSITLNQQFSRSYFGLFPSVFVNQVINATTGQAVHVSYARRLQRPAFRELNPYRLQVDNFIVNVGNPDLQPQFSHNVELGVDWKSGTAVNMYLSSSSNSIAQFVKPLPGNVLEYQYLNFSNSTEYGVNVSIPLKPAKWWSINNDLSGFHLSYLLSNGQRNQQTSFSFKSMSTLNFTRLFDMSFYLEYRSPYVSANSRFTYVLYNELGFSRRILKGDRGRIQIYVEDIFNTFKEQEFTNYNQTRIEFYQKRPTRTASLRFSYTITSGKKFANKKVDQGNADERNRL